MAPRRTALTRFGVFVQIRHAPALCALMAVMLPVTCAAILLSTASKAFAMAAFGGAKGSPKLPWLPRSEEGSQVSLHVLSPNGIPLDDSPLNLVVALLFLPVPRISIGACR